MLIDGLGNKMLFGALAGLRLAPHVREGRPAASPSSARPVATGDPGTATHPGERAAVAAPAAANEERLTLSRVAVQAYEESRARTSGPDRLDAIEPVEAQRRATGAPIAPERATESTIDPRAALAVAAYGVADAGTGQRGAIAAAPSTDPASFGPLYA